MEFWLYFQYLFGSFYIVRSSNQLQSTIAETDMPENPHFESVPSWHAAAEKLNFKPLVPGKNFRHKLKSLSIYVRDHKMRQLPIGERSLEAYFGFFMFSQAQRADADEARRQTVEVPYGRFGQEALIAGHVSRVYELGPEPPADDIDERSPSVIVWHDGSIFYMLASYELPSIDLVRIASSFYGQSTRISKGRSRRES